MASVASVKGSSCRHEEAIDDAAGGKGFDACTEE